MKINYNDDGNEIVPTTETIPINLTLFGPMFPFDPLENIRKPFLGFLGEHWEEIEKIKEKLTKEY